MTDYLDFTPDEYAVDAPATALHFERWFRNWIAGFEGATAAPRMALAAVERLVPGTSIRQRADATVNFSNSAFATLASMTLWLTQAGTIRLSFQHRRTVNGSVETRIRRTRAGSTTVLQTFSSTSGSYVTETYDAAVQPGDILDVQIRNTNGTSSDIQLLRWMTDPATYLWPTNNFGQIEGNPTLVSP